MQYLPYVTQSNTHKLCVQCLIYVALLGALVLGVA